MSTVLINCRNHVGQGQIALRGDLLQPGPERILQTHARLVSGDDDRTLNDRRFHRLLLSRYGAHPARGESFLCSTSPAHGQLSTYRGNYCLASPTLPTHSRMPGRVWSRGRWRSARLRNRAEIDDLSHTPPLSP